MRNRTMDKLTSVSVNIVMEPVTGTNQSAHEHCQSALEPWHRPDPWREPKLSPAACPFYAFKRSSRHQ